METNKEELSKSKVKVYVGENKDMDKNTLLATSAFEEDIKKIWHCKKCGNNIPIGTTTCEENGFTCHSPVLEEEKKKSKWGNKCEKCGEIITELNHYFSGRCFSLDTPPQEPIEEKNNWIEEFYQLYLKGRKNSATQSYIDYFEARHFIQLQIKQAEERHNQDCTREEWARASERERIVKEIPKIIDEYRIEKEPLCQLNAILRVIKDKIINLITNQ